MNALTAILVLSVTVLHVQGWPRYSALIPNGNNVPNPCPNGPRVLSAIGHVAMAGAGPRNAFGTLFVQRARVWDRALCQADSDGDGISNGRELGDPLCRWVAGSNRGLGRATGHPGICEPVGSPQCVNQPGCPAAAQVEAEELSLDDHGWWGGWGGWGNWGHGGHGYHDDHDSHHGDHYEHGYHH